MAGDHLTGSEKRALLLWVAAGIIGAVFAYRYFFQAFPEASVNFQISRAEAQQRAKDFVKGMSENADGYRSAIVFDVDQNAKTYLERELGLKEANRLMSSTLNIWYWDVRFFRPEKQEEFHVRVNAAGQVVGYEHTVEEARPGPSLERAAAEQIAQDFFSGKLHEDLADWEFLSEEANSTKPPNRTDWSFTWEKRAFRAKDASYRVGVTVQGERIGGATQYLRVPEEWQRSFERVRSGNDTLALAFSVPYVLVIVLAVWLGIRLTLRGQTDWRVAILLGVVVTALPFLQRINEWPLWAANYETTNSYEGFLASRLGAALGFAVVTALTITLVLPAAEPLYRASQPHQIRLYKTFTLRGLRSKEFFSATVVGLAMAAVHIGYVVAFYVIASRFGAWAPAELKYEESINTAFPWISGAAIGLLASTNEEFTFRLFAIPFLNRITGSRWVAVIVPAFLWSFLHSNYPQEPAYIRGVEIGLFGIVAGLVMLRWGILATLIWHYTVDALLVGLFLIRSNSAYFKVSGAIVAAAALAPLLFATISYVVRGRFEPDTDLLNSAKPVEGDVLAAAERAGVVEESQQRYRALAPAMLGLLLICGLAGGAVIWRFKAPAVGDYLRMSIDAKGAKSQADEVMREHGKSPESFYHSTIFLDNTDSAINEYLRERIGIQVLNEIYAHRVPGALWRVRYFKDAQAEEFAIVLRPDGTVHSFRHQLAEATAGDSLSKEHAAARAEKFLRDVKGIDLGQWTLVDSDSTKRPNRLDHTLTWQENVPLDAASLNSSTATEEHAHARIELQVLGGEVANYRTYIKIPETWRRTNEKLTLGRILLSYGVKGFAFLGLGLAALIVFLRNLRSAEARRIPWRRLAVWAAWAVVVYLALFALSGSRLLNGYVTAVPFKFYVGGTIGIGVLLGAPFFFGGVILLFGMAYYFALRGFREQELPSWSGMPGSYYRDALLIALGGSLTLVGLLRIVRIAAAHWPMAHRATDAAFGADFDTTLPGLFAFVGAIRDGLLRTAMVCAIAAFIAACARPIWLRLVIFLIGAGALVSPNWGSGADYALQYAVEAFFLATLVVGVRYVMRFNLLGCFLVIAAISALGGLGELLSQPNAFYRTNGYILLTGLVGLLAWPGVGWLRQSRATA